MMLRWERTERLLEKLASSSSRHEVERLRALAP